MTTPKILLTSLAEIRSFHPCSSGWKAILAAHPHETEDDMNKQFPLVDCVESNSISDVCWLIGKRKVEIQICVRFARMCVDFVAQYKSKRGYDAADAAAYVAASAYADDAAAYAEAVAAEAEAVTAAAAYVAAAAYADAEAAYAAAYAAAAAADTAAYAAASASDKQMRLNKSFLIQCINEFTGEV